MRTATVSAILLVVILLASANSTMASNLLTNGDFELGSVSGWDTWLYGGDAGMFVVSYSGGWTPGDGNYSMAVSLNSALSQRFNTVPGHTYRVSLIYQRWLSVPVYVRTATTGDIWTDGAVLLNSGVLPDSGAPAHTSPYLGSYTGEFTATSSLSKIVIANETYYASFDNVSVVDITEFVAQTIAAAKNAPEGMLLSISGVTVSCAFPDFFYVMQSQGVLVGIRINYKGAIPTAGSIVDVSGTVGTNQDGERCIDASSVIVQSEDGSVKPLGMRCSSVGGGAACGYQAAVSGASGPNNIGLPVRIWGNLTPVSPTRVLVSDGSGVSIPVVAPPGYTFATYYSPYPFVYATGASSCEMVGGELHPVVRLSSLSDIVSLTAQGPRPVTGRVWWDGTTDTTATAMGKLLSDNKTFYGPSVLTGVTYTYQYQPDNPADVIPGTTTFGRRLLDGIGEGDWTTPVGVNYLPIVVTFDFKRRCTFTEVDITPTSPNGIQKHYVRIDVSDYSNGPWTKVYERSKEDAPQTKMVRMRMGGPAAGRYMKLTVGDSVSGQQCMSEVWVWGNGTVNETFPEDIDPVYTAPPSGLYSIPGIASTWFDEGQFNSWKSTLGSYANQAAVWSPVSTWGTISGSPILPPVSNIVSGRSVTVDTTRNMKEYLALALTNTSLTNATVNVALDDFKLNGEPVSTVKGTLRVMGAMPAASGGVQLTPLFSANNMLCKGLMMRYVTNGEYISGFPSVTLTPGGSAVFWLSIETKNATPGVYTAVLSGSVGSPVTIYVTVNNITLPSPSPTWVHTWGTTTTRQVPFVGSDWMQNQVDYALGLGISVWNEFPTAGTVSELVRAAKPNGLMYHVWCLPFNGPAMIPSDITPEVTAQLAASINSLVTQAQTAGLSYDEWYVELWDEPGIGTSSEVFGALAQIIKDTDPNVNIYCDPLVWGEGIGWASDSDTYDAFSPWYNSCIDISVPQEGMDDPVTRPLSWSLWNAPRLARASYNHWTNGKDESGVELVRRQAWRAFDKGWNGWACFGYHCPFTDPWNDNDADHLMAHAGPNGPVPTRRAEGIGAGWEEYCLLTLMAQRGLTSQLNGILSDYRTGASLQTLRHQMIDYLK